MYIYLFFIIIGFLVLTSTIVMTMWFKTNRILNFYIIFTSLLLCSYLITHGLNNFKYNQICNDILWFNYYQIVLILTPSVYLFFEKLIINSKYPQKKDFIYFFVPLLSCYYLGTEEFERIFIVKIIIFILFLFYTLFFCRKSYLLLKPYLWNKYYEVDILLPVVKNWANFIFKMMVIVKIHFIVFFILSFFKIKSFYNLILEAGLLVVFLIGYFKVVFSPLLLYGNSKISQDTNGTSSYFVNKVWGIKPFKRIDNSRDIRIYNLIQDKISAYIEHVEYLALKNYSFRKLDYSINDLSAEIGIPKYYLEFIFKYYCKVSFNDYKKIIRIFDSVNLINEGYLASNTLDTLSRYVGFASYNPFLINFKEIVGISPFDYYKKKTVILNKKDK